MHLSAQLGTTYKTAWYMLKCIREVMDQRDQTHKLDGAIDFDDVYFGGPVTGKKHGHGTEKVKVFVALSLDSHGHPRYLKMQITPDIKQASVKKFATQWRRKVTKMKRFTQFPDTPVEVPFIAGTGMQRFCSASLCRHRCRLN